MISSSHLSLSFVEKFLNSEPMSAYRVTYDDTIDSYYQTQRFMINDMFDDIVSNCNWQKYLGPDPENKNRIRRLVAYFMDTAPMDMPVYMHHHFDEVVRRVVACSKNVGACGDLWSTVITTYFEEHLRTHGSLPPIPKGGRR